MKILSTPRETTETMTDGQANPLVDVFLPTYGDVPYVAQAIDSVLAQTETRWRFTVVDNSPERGEVRAALVPYEGDARIRYLVTGGFPQHANWTAGLQAGSAPYVAMIHDDDWWQPEFLSNRLSFLERNPRCGFAFSNYREIDETGAEIAERAPRLPEGVYEPEEFTPREYPHNLVPVPSVMFRRAALKSVGEAYPDVHSPDWGLSLLLGMRAPVGYLHVRDCYVRLHKGSVTSTRMTSRGEGWLRQLDFFDASVDAVDPSLVPDAIRRARRAACHLTVALDAAQTGDPVSARRHVRAALDLNPKSVVDVRVPVVLALSALGSRAGAALDRVRRLQLKYHIPVHRGDMAMLLADFARAASVGGPGRRLRQERAVPAVERSARPGERPVLAAVPSPAREMAA